MNSIGKFFGCKFSKKFLTMENKTSSIFEKIKYEEGRQVIDLEASIDKYEMLSMMFHEATIPIDDDIVISTIKCDKRRFFEDTTICYNCGVMGHVSRDCPTTEERNCIYCDINHKGKSCDFLFCNNCFKLGHLQKNCREKKLAENICNCNKIQYHYNDECPSKWRKYKIKKTASKSKDFVMSCPLCFEKSHFIDDCEKQDRKYTIFTKNFLKLIAKPKRSE